MLDARSALMGWLAAKPGWQKLVFFLAISWGLLQFVWWCCRNPKYSLPVIFAIFAGFKFSSLNLALFVLVASSVGITFLWLAKLLRHSEIDTWRELIVGVPRILRVVNRWDEVCDKVGLSRRNDVGGPALYNLRLSTSGVIATVDTGVIGQHPSILKKHELNMSASYRADRVLFRRDTNWSSTMRIDWGAHLRRIYHLGDIPESSNDTVWPYRIPFGVAEDGKAAEVVANEPILLGGVTGSGKSHTAWSILAGYIKLGVPIKVDVVDWSGSEFGALKALAGTGIVGSYVGGACSLKENCEHYKSPGCTLGDIDAMLKKFLGAAQRRTEAMLKEGIRVHVPSEKEPLRLLLVDEGLPLAESLRKQGSGHPLVLIASQGRKANYIVLFNTQAGQKDVLGLFRELTSTRISMKTMSRVNTEVVLGEGCEGDGARCSDLDQEHDKGVGYMTHKGSYQGFRSAKVSDADVTILATGRLPDVEVSERSVDLYPHIVYRLYDITHRLLYVGITHIYRGTPEAEWDQRSEAELARTAAANRAREHIAHQPWGYEITDHSIDIDRDVYDNKRDALDAEELAIRTESPPYNKIHNESYWEKLKGEFRAAG